MSNGRSLLATEPPLLHQSDTYMPTPSDDGFLSPCHHAPRSLPRCRPAAPCYVRTTHHSVDSAYLGTDHQWRRADFTALTCRLFQDCDGVTSGTGGCVRTVQRRYLVLHHYLGDSPVQHGGVACLVGVRGDPTLQC